MQLLYILRKMSLYLTLAYYIIAAYHNYCYGHRKYTSWSRVINGLKLWDHNLRLQRGKVGFIFDTF